MDNSGFSKIAIIGFGQLGCSLGLAARELGVERMGWGRRAESRAEAVASGAVDCAPDSPEAALRDAELTIVCLPLPATLEFVRTFAGAWKPGAVVTDVGSVKTAIAEGAKEALKGRGVHFVGGHPMAGSEKSGAGAAREDLYRGATVFVTPDADTCPEAARRVERFWLALGAKPLRFSPREHDAIVAHTSHISHLTAMATVLTVLDCPETVRRAREAGCAGGFRDTTRIASSPPPMWREIFEFNREELLKAYDTLTARLGGVRDLIAAGDFDAVEAALAKARTLRDAWLETYRPGKPPR